MENAESTTARAESKDAGSASEVASRTSINHGEEKRGEVVIHVRFHPTGLVNTINQRPDHLSAQDWFDRLCRAAPSTYQPLSGGRAAFRIPSHVFDAIWRENAG